MNKRDVIAIVLPCIGLLLFRAYMEAKHNEECLKGLEKCLDAIEYAEAAKKEAESQ